PLVALGKGLFSLALGLHRHRTNTTDRRDLELGRLSVPLLHGVRATLPCVPQPLTARVVRGCCCCLCISKSLITGADNARLGAQPCRMRSSAGSKLGPRVSHAAVGVTKPLREVVAKQQRHSHRRAVLHRVVTAVEVKLVVEISVAEYVPQLRHGRLSCFSNCQ